MFVPPSDYWPIHISYSNETLYRNSLWSAVLISANLLTYVVNFQIGSVKFPICGVPHSLNQKLSSIFNCIAISFFIGSIKANIMKLYLKIVYGILYRPVQIYLIKLKAS